ncbi:Disulfide bond formation protein DsbB [Rhizobiales bacterium GAS188]|nr:Disulfide bond formation protein DsbB [Rhizobiales bacterium GAS188]
MMAVDTALPQGVALPSRAALTAFALAALAIGGAWVSQLFFGLQPCELCLLERWPYYVGVPLALLAVIAMRGAMATSRNLGGGLGSSGLGSSGLGTWLLALVALVFLAGTGLGIYHAGVEWHFWEGPSACTGQYAAPASTDDFLKSLEAGPSIRCDEAAIRILGLSLAGWNAVISLLIAAIAVIGVRAARR